MRRCAHFCAPMPHAYPIPAELAPAFEGVAFPVTLTAAQALTLEGLATRYRCTEGELLCALALGRLEALASAGHDAQDGAVLADLLEYADAGRVPPVDAGLPFELAKGGPRADWVRRMKAKHGHGAALVRFDRGEISGAELIEQAAHAARKGR